MLEPITDKFEEFDNYEDFTDLKTDELLTEIWLKPKKVFSYLFKHEPYKYVNPLLLTSGFAGALKRTSEKSMDFGVSFNFVTVIAGSLIAFLLYYVVAWIYKFFGSAFLNGKATSRQFRTVIAWGYIPSILTAVTSLLYYMVYGSYDTVDFESFTPQNIIFWLVALIELSLGVYSIVLIIIGTMHVQKFGVWKALGNIFLPVIIIAMVFVIVFVLGDVIAN